ncbi:MAG: Hsp70 family protein [Proteobacteria bacterium]|nr:Hsp70 family protein [Pseudomonadota bacterium]
MPFAAIDFGTSNSTVGILQHGAPLLLQPNPGHSTAPTAVFFPFEKNAPTHFGHAAVQAYLAEDPGRFMRGLKGVLGSSLFAETTQGRNQRLNFSTIIATYLQWLLAAATQHLGQAPTHLALGRPVHFHTQDLAADALAETQLRSVVQSLGIHHLALVPEPLAAAYHYESTLTQNQCVLVVDIGGGTTDLTAIRLGPSHAGSANRAADILATHGLRLGGTDIDKLFAMAHVMPLFGLGSALTGAAGEKGLTVPAAYYHMLTTWHRIHRLYEKEQLAEVRTVEREAAEPAKLARLIRLLSHHHGHRLMFTVEDSKIALSENAQTTLALTWLEQNLALPLTQTQLESAIEGWRSNLAAAIAETLARANLTAAQLSAVFLTGGPSAMPLVQTTVRQQLPATPLIQGDQLTSVGHGLTLAASRLFAPA